MTVMTGRPITPAVERPDRVDRRVRWTERSRCLGLDTELFYSANPGEQEAARALCRRCPVVADCLTSEARFDDLSYTYGMFGGLTEVQRLALRAERIMGHVPDLVVAQRLVRGEWRIWMLLTLPGCRRLSEVCAALARAGMVADEVTVRVAVWWLGYSMGRLPRADSGDRRRVRVRLREDYTDLIRRLMKAGLRYVDIAAYLDVSHADVTNAMQDLARAESGSAA